MDVKRFLKTGSWRERWLAAVIFALSLVVAGNIYVLRTMMVQAEGFATRAMACEIERFTRTLPLRPRAGLTL